MPSILTIVTPATSTSLVTRAYVKSELSITDNSEDARIDSYIAQASAAIAGWCGRVFARETLTETIRLTSPISPDQLVLARFPVVSIASVVEDGTTLDAADYEANAENGLLRRLSNDAIVSWSGSKIVVSYTAGYSLPNSAPEALQRACVDLVAYYRASAGRDPSLRSESVEGIDSASYFDGAGERGGLPPAVAGLLQQFQIPSFG